MQTGDKSDSHHKSSPISENTHTGHVTVCVGLVDLRHSLNQTGVVETHDHYEDDLQQHHYYTNPTDQRLKQGHFQLTSSKSCLKAWHKKTSPVAHLKYINRTQLLLQSIQHTYQ